MSQQTKKNKRAQRQQSNVFAMFDQRQIGEFKEAFSMMDHDQDGFIDKDDLKDMLSSLGESPSESEIESLFAEAPGSINFTNFLTLFGAKLGPTDSAFALLRAFEVLDSEKKGTIDLKVYKKWMTTRGDRLTQEEMDSFFKDAPLDDLNQFNYREWVRVLKLCE